jgi:REase_DpnII-MboI
MDYQAALAKLEALRGSMDKLRTNISSASSKQDHDELCVRYGEAEEIIEQFGGVSRVEVPMFGSTKPSVYPNFIEEGYLSGRTIHQHEGYTQLLKIMGKVRQAAAAASAFPSAPSITNLVQALGRFRECCQYIQAPPQNEREVQDILWIMLRSQYDRVDREDTLPRFGAKSYKPDFGITDLQVLVEVKFVGDKSNIASIQEEILADVPGYLNEATNFRGIMELVYDRAHKLRDPRKFIEDLRTVSGILDVIVVPGIS